MKIEKHSTKEEFSVKQEKKNKTLEKKIKELTVKQRKLNQQYKEGVI